MGGAWRQSGVQANRADVLEWVFVRSVRHTRSPSTGGRL